jgi:tRNA (adenine37-N6)-methyltransferase
MSGATFELSPIGHVRATRTTAVDDFWGATISEITLADGFAADSLAGLEAFSHVEVIYVFDRVTPDQIVTTARHPRNNPAWPKIGIFAQRGKNRPNRLGVSVARIVGVDGRTLRVAELDAIDGTPVVDLKPVMREFLPRGDVRQPAWASELMSEYWLAAPTL